MKKNQILLVSIIGILTLSALSINAQAHRYRKRVNFRPIDDWVSINPFGILIEDLVDDLDDRIHAVPSPFNSLA